ncbi:MAG: hypothetical protein MUE60_15915 [Candidatus Eisenbacteria bacterium]|jgi:hypothetical protein|nr:hypothetical protein [Candidatus Eisenbacteria bacterium]
MKTKQDVLDWLGADSEESAARAIYKATECGAWIRFEDDGIALGSIVEGSDAEVGPYHLKYADDFEPAEVDNLLDDINAEADVLWHEANDYDLEAPEPFDDPPRIFGQSAGYLDSPL